MNASTHDQPVRSPVTYPDADVPLYALETHAGGGGHVHRHTGADWEICYVRTGQVVIDSGADQTRLEAGDVAVTAPDEGHAYRECRGARWVVIARETLLRKTACRLRCRRRAGLEVGGVRLPKRMRLAGHHRAALEDTLARLSREAFGRHEAKQAMCLGLLTQMLVELARAASQPTPALDTHVTEAARRCVERLMAEMLETPDALWPLDAMVRRSGYGPTHLTGLFKHLTGLTPRAWLVEQRVYRARDLLANTDLSTWDISAAVGFGSRSQFHRAFRRVMGVPPARFRALARHMHGP